MKAFDVFVEAIRFIKQHMMENANDPTRMGDVTIRSEKDIHWVLTVPAIWNDLAKRFMREAAVDVSLLNLSTLYNPSECILHVAFYCMSFLINKPKRM